MILITNDTLYKKLLLIIDAKNTVVMTVKFERINLKITGHFSRGSSGTIVPIALLYVRVALFAKNVAMILKDR